MTTQQLINNVRTMMRRYASAIESGDHVLRGESQYEIAHSRVEYHKETDPKTGQIHTNGYYVGPGGLGKSIDGGVFILGINTVNGRNVLGDLALGKRVLVGVPTNELVDGWADALLGKMDEDTGLREPSLFGDRFTEDNVGIIHSGMPAWKKEIELAKPVVLAVHDTIRILHEHTDPDTSEHDPLIRPQDFDVLWIDEVDDKVRGDVHREFYRNMFFSHCLVIGCTATHLFRSGKTIGDYLFDGKKPFCEITHEEGVTRYEIAPHVNIIVQPEMDVTPIIPPRIKSWDDLSEDEQLYFIRQTGTDNALLESIEVGHHPITGKPLRNMMQLHQAINIEHGKYITEQLNEKFGRGFAQTVWGGTDAEMDDEIRRIAEWCLKTGSIQAVVQCKLWGRGKNIPELEMTVQHSLILSPNKLVQFHTRASRLGKIAIYLSPHIIGFDQLIIGEVLGGLYMLPNGWEFPPTTGHRNNPSRPTPWPDIKGVKVYVTQRQLEMFAAERRRQRYIDGLPVKGRHMLSLEETALHLGVDRTILRERVFSPLQEAYERKKAREKFVDIESGRRGDVLYVHGKMFPAWRVGFFQAGKQEKFCVDKDLIPLCEHTLYGRLDRAPPEVLGRDDTKRLLGCNEAQIAELWQRLQYAFFHRRPYEHRVEIDGVHFSYDDFKFYRNPKGASEFFLFPDALIPAYRHINKVDQKTAEQWAQQPRIRQFKTSSWLMESEVMEALELNPLLGHQETFLVKNLFNDLGKQARGLRLGQERDIEMGRGRDKQVWRVSQRWLPLGGPSLGQTALCIHKDSLEWIKQALGIEGARDSGPRTYRGRRPRPGDDSALRPQI